MTLLNISLFSRGLKPGPSPKPDRARASVCRDGPCSGLNMSGRPGFVPGRACVFEFSYQQFQIF